MLKESLVLVQSDTDALLIFTRASLFLLRTHFSIEFLPSFFCTEFEGRVVSRRSHGVALAIAR